MSYSRVKILTDMLYEGKSKENIDPKAAKELAEGLTEVVDHSNLSEKQSKTTFESVSLGVAKIERGMKAELLRLQTGLTKTIDNIYRSGPDLTAASELTVTTPRQGR